MVERSLQGTEEDSIQEVGFVQGEYVDANDINSLILKQIILITTEMNLKMMKMMKIKMKFNTFSY